MALNRPTLQTIINRIAADFKASITGAITLALRAVLMVLARVVGGAIHMLYGYADNIVRELFVATASGTYLDRLGSELGVTRKAAVKATGTIAITGDADSVIPAGTEFTSSDGFVYTTDEEATIPGGGSIDVNITAELGGADYNDVAAAVLTIVSPIAGVDSQAIVNANGITGGTDLESDTDYRARIFLRKRKPPHGGVSYDYVNWALEVNGVTRAWVLEQLYGEGTLGLTFVRDDDADIFPSALEVADVSAYVLEHTDADGKKVGVPVTATPGLFVFAPHALAVNYNISIYPNTAAVQAAVEQELNDLHLRDAGPRQTLYISSMQEAIANAAGIERFRINYPIQDVTALYDEVHVPGTLTWSNY